MSDRESDRDWHSRSVDQTLDALGTKADGLDSETAHQRLEEHGYNRLPQPPRRGPLMRFLGQFHNILIYVLIAAAVGTALLGHWLDTGVILGVVLINATIGHIQEGKAEKALEAIRGMLSPQAQVLRDGQRRSIPAEKLVPGDIVYLQAGDRVPADLRLIGAHNMRVDEATLTGESIASDKQTDPVDSDTDLGDRRSMA